MSTEKSYEESCPVCKTKWTKTPRPAITGFWTHCIPCNKKADTILAEEAERKAAKSAESVKSTEKSGNKATSKAFSSYQMDLWESWGDDDGDYWGGL
jgi:hypothetical protein